MWGNVLGRVTGKIETGGSIRSNQVKRLSYVKCFNVNLKVDTNWLLTVVVRYLYLKIR